MTSISESETSETKKMPAFYIWVALLLLLLAVDIFWIVALQLDYFGGVTDENVYIYCGLVVFTLFVLWMAHCALNAMARSDGVL